MFPVFQYRSFRIIEISSKTKTSQSHMVPSEFPKTVMTSDFYSLRVENSETNHNQNFSMEESFSEVFTLVSNHKNLS